MDPDFYGGLTPNVRTWSHNRRIGHFAVKEPPMRRWNFALMIIFVACFAQISEIRSQEEEEEPPQLLGVVTAEQLGEEPYVEWSRKGYDEYTPDPSTLESLRAIDFDDAKLSLFFGTWCGDSQREVPRILKLLNELGFPAEKLRLIAVSGTDKRSPGGEERGREVYRVPTLVVERDGQEVSRLVEHPAISLERDLLAILSGSDYQPSYASYPVVRRWLREGLLADANVSPSGLATELRYTIASEGELAAAASVLLARGETAEAIKLYEVNRVLHRDSSRSAERLANAFIEAGDLETGWKWAERAIELNDDPERVASLLELVAKTTP
jgi:thiol-disulfide isomerase/thioredoxin